VVCLVGFVGAGSVYANLKNLERIQRTRTQRVINRDHHLPYPGHFYRPLGCRGLDKLKMNRSKFTAAQRKIILQRSKSESQISIVRRFGVNQTTIGRILKQEAKK
jgi:hypothetical protein